MYCKHCGKQIDNDSLFCPHCGTKLSDSKNPSNNQEENKEQKANEIISAYVRDPSLAPENKTTTTTKTGTKVTTYTVTKKPATSGYAARVALTRSTNYVGVVGLIISLVAILFLILCIFVCRLAFFIVGDVLSLTALAFAIPGFNAIKEKPLLDEAAGAGLAFSIISVLWAFIMMLIIIF